MTNHSRFQQAFPKCIWPGCVEYADPDLGVKVCVSHCTIITHHGMQNETVSGLVEAMAPTTDTQPARRAAPVDGTIYFLQSNGYVKIGRTSDLDRRMREYDPAARILAVKPGTRSDERKLHQKFSHLRTARNEWYATAPQVMEEVQRTVKVHGDPPRSLNEPVATTKIVGPRLNGYTQMRARSRR